MIRPIVCRTGVKLADGTGTRTTGGAPNVSDAPGPVRNVSHVPREPRQREFPRRPTHSTRSLLTSTRDLRPHALAAREELGISLELRRSEGGPQDEHPQWILLVGDDFKVQGGGIDPQVQRYREAFRTIEHSTVFGVQRQQMRDALSGFRSSQPHKSPFHIDLPMSPSEHERNPTNTK